MTAEAPETYTPPKLIAKWRREDGDRMDALEERIARLEQHYHYTGATDMTGKMVIGDPIPSGGAYSHTSEDREYLPDA